MSTTPEFSRVRRMLFPIHRHELRKFIPLTSIFFTISFNYSSFRSLKDIYVLPISAEALYYLKLFGVTPGIVLLTVLYGRLSKRAGRDTRFNVVAIYFLIFFALSYYLFIPYLEVVKLDLLADRLNARIPAVKNLWELLRYWPLSLFYINAEAWGTMVLGVLFWTFANEITGLEQAKRIYSFLSLGAAVGIISSGILLSCLKERFASTLGLCLGLIVLMLVMYNIFARDIRNNPSLYQVAPRPKKKKEKLSFLASLKFLAKSQCLTLIAVLVLSYGTVISLFESVWKSKMRELAAADAGLLATIYGSQSIASGILSLLLIFFFSAPIMKRGWRFAASVTPTIAFVATVVFFAFLYFQDALSGVMALFGSSPLYVAVICGLANVVFVKSVKYILFDPTKEQAYIPLDEEAKVRGKAAVDGVGSRLGKSLGSVIITILSSGPVLGSIDNAKYVICFLIIALLVVWLGAVNRLSRLLKVHSEKVAAETTVR